MRRITEFWTWFQYAEAEIRKDLNFNNRESSIHEALGLQLESISPNLGLKLSRNSSLINPRYYLNITCNGDRDYFILVNSIIDQAPKIQGWKFKAFITPAGNPEKLIKEEFVFESCVIAANNIKFAIHNFDLEKGVFDLVFLIPLRVRHLGEEKLKVYLYYLFEDIWGEKFVGRRFNTIHFVYHELEQYSFLELEDLHFVLENFRLVMGMDPECEI